MNYSGISDEMEQSLLKRVRFSSLGSKLTDPEIVRLMSLTLKDPSLLSLAAGFTDNAAMPVEIVSEVIEELAALEGEPEYMQYGISSGRMGLREGVGEFLLSYPGEGDIPLDPNHVLVTNGSQQALYIATQVLCDPGDIVLVEQPTYFVFLEVLKGLGVQPVSMPVRENGRIDFDKLSSMLEGFAKEGTLESVKTIYIVTYFANPSARCMPEEDKRRLGSLLHSLPAAIPFMEDAAYRELYYGEPYPAPSHMSLPEFASLPTLYTGTFTKPFSTGMKVGYAYCSDREWLDNMMRVKGQQDFGTANFTQAVIERVVRDGRYAGFLKKLRGHYERKMKTLQDVLVDEGLHELGWRWEIPEGGILMWLRAPGYLDTGLDSAFCRACIEDGVLYVPGELFFAERWPQNYLRLSLGGLEDERLQEAGKRFVATARKS